MTLVCISDQETELSYLSYFSLIWLFFFLSDTLSCIRGIHQDLEAEVFSPQE